MTKSQGRGVVASAIDATVELGEAAKDLQSSLRHVKQAGRKGKRATRAVARTGKKMLRGAKNAGKKVTRGARRIVGKRRK